MIIHIQLLVLVGDQQIEIAVLRILNADNTVFLLAVAQFKGVQLKVVGQQIKGNFLLPYAAGEHLSAVVQGGVEEDGSVDGVSVFGSSYIYIEGEGIFSIGVDAERQRALAGALDGVAVAKDLNQAHSQYLRRIAEHYRKLHALQQMILLECFAL